MADRYWVGGTGSWTTSSTTNWSASSGGASGASVPTAADSVFFDQAGTYTVTLTGALACLNFNVSAGAITFTSTGTLAIDGSMSITNVTPAWPATGLISFIGGGTGKTITTNGVSFTAGFNFQGSGAVWTLGSSLTTAEMFLMNLGTFDTSSVGNYSITASYIQTGASLSAFINFNASTITLTNASVPLILQSPVTINTGTSQINITSNTNVSFAGGSRTYYNVAFTGLPTSSGITASITGLNTFNNLSVVAPSVVGYRNVTFAANQTINGTLSTTGTAGNRRIFFASVTTGIQYDLAINSTPSLTDADFRDLRITGTAAPISGTRIGNQTGCSGITFDAPKTVYWNLPAGGNWTATAWAPSSGGTVSVDNFPLPQDTAVIVNTGLNTGAQVTVDINAAIGTIDISGRTTVMTLAFGSTAPTLYGDLKLSTSVTVSGSNIITFGGRNTQTITSVGRTIPIPTIIDSPGGTVQLADALNITTNLLTITNGTFDTKNFNVTAGAISSTNSNVRTINLGSSTVTLSSSTGTTFATTTNLTFNAGTSLIVFSASSTGTQLASGGLTFYDVSFTGTSSGINATITGNNTYRNLSFTAPSGGILQYLFSGNQTITGTLTCAGATAVRRVFFRSDTLGTTRTVTVNSLSATDCDFRDITIAGAAAGSSPTRAGDCGGNSGITFPAAKTVYWNLGGGSQDWSATGWAPSSGGTPDINNFPLAQDTAVFDDAGAITRVATDDGWNIGTVNMSSRTTAMEWSSNISASYYGNWLFGTGVTTISNSGTMSFLGRGTQTITSNGVTINNPVEINCNTGTVQLADALILASSRTLTLTSGTFNAVTYNVTSGAFSSNNSNTRTLRMGTGTWTLSSSGGAIWETSTTTNLVFYKDSANIVLSDNGSTFKTFNGGGLSYNKLTIGGTTSVSTVNILGNGSQFTELASTRTVAYTIGLGTDSTKTFGKWSVTGTAGNVVTVTGTGTSYVIAGARVTGVDYLAMGTIGFSATSPGEFYAGANSTGSNATIIKAAAPAPVTRYWRGGTGTWDATTTTNWSDTSGGSGGFSVPTSADAVIFDSASNATAYTVTLTATQLCCASLSVSGPATGNLTWAGTAPLSVTQSLTMASTGITRTWTNGFTFAGTGSGKTISLGQAIAGGIVINGVGASWALTAGLSNSGAVTLTNGSFDTAGFALSFSSLSTSAGVTGNPVTLSLGASTLTSSTAGGGINFTGSSTTYNPTNLTFNPGSSTININGNGNVFYHGGKTFWNVALNDSTAGVATPLNQSIFTPTFNNFTIATASLTGFKTAQLSSNLIINGTFTVTASTGPSRKLLLVSDTLGTQRTITAAAVSGLADIDMRDINCAGAASWTGTRIGDLGGNTNAPTSTPKTVYWNFPGGGSWSGAVWAPSSGGTASALNMPLAQDTAIIENAGLNTSATITIDNNWHIGTINMSTRTNAMTLATGTTTPTIYGDWTFGTGVTNTGTGSITFAKRGTQTITSNGRSFTQPITINNINGTVQLADALTTSSSITLTSGTFDAVSYNVTCSIFNSTGTATRTLSLGSGLITTTSSGNQWNMSATGLTFNKGTANIVATAATAATSFVGAGLTYNKLTIAGGTNASLFSMTGNNTFSEIASTRTVAYTFGLSSTTQRVGAFTVSGSAGNRVTITGTSVAAPVTLIFTGATFANLDYIIPTFVKVYDINSDWYAGDNSINGGSYGWIFAAGVIVASAINGQFFAFF